MPKKIKPIDFSSAAESSTPADHNQYNDFGEPLECLQKGNSGRPPNPKILTSDEIKSIANALAIPLKTTGQRMPKKSTKILLQNIIRVLEDL